MQNSASSVFKKKINRREHREDTENTKKIYVKDARQKVTINGRWKMEDGK